MSGRFQPGDVCLVVRSCCEVSNAYVGLECTVVRMVDDPLTCSVQNGARGCRARWPRYVGLLFDHEPYASGMGNKTHCLPEEFLVKKPPKADDQGEPRADHVPAIEDDWKNIGWHPSKTRVPA